MEKIAQINQAGSEKHSRWFDFPVSSARLPPNAPFFFQQKHIKILVLLLRIGFVGCGLCSLKERQTQKGLNQKCIIIQGML